LLRDRKQCGNKQTFACDSAASSGGQAKFVSFPWPPREAALPFLTLSFLVKKKHFEAHLMKTENIVINAQL